MAFQELAKYARNFQARTKANVSAQMLSLILNKAVVTSAQDPQSQEMLAFRAYIHTHWGQQFHAMPGQGWEETLTMVQAVTAMSDPQRTDFYGFDG